MAGDSGKPEVVSVGSRVNRMWIQGVRDPGGDSVDRGSLFPHTFTSLPYEGGGGVTAFRDLVMTVRVNFNGV